MNFKNQKGYETFLKWFLPIIFYIGLMTFFFTLGYLRENPQKSLPTEVGTSPKK